MAGSCVHGKEPSGSVKGGKLTDWLSVMLAAQEGLCSTELDFFVSSIENFHFNSVVIE
jgi:hypothetical protein